MHMYVLPVLLDPVSALDQFKGGPDQTRTRIIEDRSEPVLSGPVLVLKFSEDFRTGPDFKTLDTVVTRISIDNG